MEQVRDKNAPLRVVDNPRPYNRGGKSYKDEYMEIIRSASP